MAPPPPQPVVPAPQPGPSVGLVGLAGQYGSDDEDDDDEDTPAAVRPPSCQRLYTCLALTSLKHDGTSIDDLCRHHHRTYRRASLTRT